MSQAAALAAFHAQLAKKSTIILKDVVPEFMREQALRLIEKLIAATPIDTGYARGNWQLTIETPAVAPLQIFDRGTLGDPKGPALTAAKNVAKGITTMTKSIYISNLADYITLIIEDGHSGQAPPGTLSNLLTAEGLR